MEYSSREIISMLAADGWQEVACVGSHHHFKHPKGEKAMKNEYAFIAVLEYADDGISISFPDLPGCFSCAGTNNADEAVRNAREALGLHLFAMEQDGEEIPEPRTLNDMELGKNCVPAVIDVFMPSVRAAVKTAFVKKTLSLPSWLAALAEEKNVNCSKVFQDALKTFLGVEDSNVYCKSVGF